MKRITTIAFLLFSGVTLYAQEEKPVVENRTSDKPEKIPELRQMIKGGFSLPSPVNNKAFQKTVDGIADAYLSYQYPFAKAFYIGAGFRYTYFQINDFVINNKINANLQVYAPFVVLGYEKFANPRIFYGAGVKTGFSFLSFFSNSCSTVDPDSHGHGQQAFFVEPNATIGMMAGENVSFSFNISHTIAFEEYGPENVCLVSFSGLSPSDNVGNYSYFSVGFGFTAYLGGERKKGGTGYRGY